MRFGSSFLCTVLAAGFLMPGAITAKAQDEIPLDFGTYSQSKDWCKVSRSNRDGPDYKTKRAFINLSEAEINWNDTVGKITNVSVEGKKINLAVQLTTNGQTESKTLPLVRKNQKLFVLTGINFFYCADFQPNPRLGR